MSNLDINNCPCGRDKTFEHCCGKIHHNRINALTAEDLMRSRYTGFVIGNGQYLNDSHSVLTRNEAEKQEIENWAKSVKWQKLEIINTTFGQETDIGGTVEFKAYFKEGFRKRVIHENSKFIRENGLWVYLGEA